MRAKLVGKKNIVFGFIFLLLTAALGPYMIKNLLPDVGQAQVGKQQHVGRLQALAQNDFEEELETIGAEQLSRANTQGILALNQLHNSRVPVDAVKAGPHAHGNLEAILNIAVGIVLCFMAAPILVKQLISWIFIAGTLLHSGLLYLRVFDVPGSEQLLNTGLGPVLILVGLLGMGIAAALWFRGEVVTD